MTRSTLRLSLLVPFLLAGCSGERAPAGGGGAGPAAVPVIVDTLRVDTARTRLEAVGTSRALRSIELYPAVSGEVIDVRFRPGQRVARGEVLVELERREQELAVSLAQVRLEDAERLYDRYRRSGDSGAVLPTTIDAAATAVESARIELERARVALDFRTLRAPFDGYVGITEVDPGDRIGPETMITTLDDRSALLVSFEAPETLIDSVTQGAEVGIETWTGRRSAGSGLIEDIDSRIDPVTRTFQLRARVDNASDTLRPGMSFRVTVDIPGTAFPVVAETAVQWGADGPFVWSVVDGRAERQAVNVVQRREGRVLIDTELPPGSLIVVEGTQRMRSGVDVRYESSALASGGGPASLPEAD